MPFSRAQTKFSERRGAAGTYGMLAKDVPIPQ